jgi:iron(III) transport system ATP-binding protein
MILVSGCSGNTSNYGPAGMTRAASITSIPGTTPAGEPLLALSGITHTYDGSARAVDEVSLEIAPNEVVCLLGPSGCGKSTLLRIAAGLERAQTGRVSIRGRTMADPAAGYWTPPERRNVGLVFQDSALFPHLTVLENVTFGLERNGRGRAAREERDKRAMALLQQLHIESHARAYPHMLSGGQQQRVALARALAPAPSLMLLDEPFSSLDARLRDRIRDDTLHVLKSSGAGTLLVTHDPEEAMFMADRIALMRNGRIVQIGAPEELYCRPVDPFVVGFFGEVNVLRGRVHGGRISTPVGTVAANGFAEGEEAMVMVRPEALRIVGVGERSAGHNRSHVIAARLLGRYSLIHLCVHSREQDSGPTQEMHLHARVHGVFLPEAGQTVELDVDESQLFVFPACAESGEA